MDEKFLGFYRPWFGDTRDESFTGFMKLRGWISSLKGESGDRNFLASTNIAGLDVHELALKLFGHESLIDLRTC